jgi:hypothetical protein
MFKNEFKLMKRRIVNRTPSDEEDDTDTRYNRNNKFYSK